MDDESICWMSHMDYIDKAPEGFDILATTGSLSGAHLEAGRKRFTEYNSIRKYSIQ